MRRSVGICYLYAITRIASGQRYVGLTINPVLRWWTHCWSAGRSPQLIHKAIAKYGQTAFTFEILACSQNWKDAVLTEQQLISQLGSHVSIGGYNLTYGGEGPKGRICSEETRAKIGAANKGRGHPIPDAQREIHRARMLETYRKHPEYRIQFARLSIESRIRNGNTGMGRKNSPETLARMREAALQRWAKVGFDERRQHMQAAISTQRRMQPCSLKEVS